MAGRAQVACWAAVALAAGWWSPAQAYPSEVGWPTFYRSGPGRNYVVLDELDRGVHLDVAQCEAGWCRVNWENTTGYVEQTALLNPAAFPDKPPVPGPQGCVQSRVTGPGYKKGLYYEFCPR